PEHAVRWHCDPRATLPLGDVLASWQPEQSTLVLVGPEGGFDDAEQELARAAGLTSVSLGPLTLRTETAALAVCSALYVRRGAAKEIG
ncbi:MAG TPA: RsmE family RNA methyltransferase, partial [Polyangiaceae bacterium]|nr:RsmE family RNA methyltransferase [Polyangiaceae bacterium]